MTLQVGNTLKLISADPSAVVMEDWINARQPAPGDIVVVEETSNAEAGRIVRLLCEPREGFLEWRIWIHEAGLVYELLC